MPSTVQAFFEPRFGSDFSQVRVHTDANAAGTAKALNAKAFTVGRDVVFGAGQYEPASNEGRRLLAHELTHVVQQSGADISLKDPPPTLCRPVRPLCGNIPGSTPGSLLQRQGGGGAAPASHRFTAAGVNVVVRRSCASAVFGFANVEAATRAALDAIFNSTCIEESRRRRIQRNLTAHGIDIRCRRSANLQTPGACAESTGYYIPANIFTLGSRSFPGHPDALAACMPLESTILHEIVHLTRGFAGESLPGSCEASCFGAGGGNPDLCRNIDVFGRRSGGP